MLLPLLHIPLSPPPPLHHPARAPRPAASAAVEVEAALLQLLEGTGGRGKGLTAAQRAKVDELAVLLETETAGKEDTNCSPELPGRWRVLYQGKPGTQTDFFSVESWRKYLSGDGPSPIQNLVAGSGAVDRLYQVLELESGGGRINNVVDFSDASPLAGVLAIEADLEGAPQPSRLSFRFSGGSVVLRAVWNGSLALPYPVPFKLLGDNAVGWLQTDYLSPSLRLSRGNKGSLFVLVPEPLPDDANLEALLDPPPPPPPPPPPAELSAGPVLICPAQFGTAADYADLLEALQARGHPASVAPLKRLDWFEILKSTFTAEYWQGDLRAETALPFYFKALDEGLSAAAAAHPGRKVTLVAHSIGGWIARAYLGQLSEERRALVGKLVTLGTPHRPPPPGFLTAIDQTRGLLRNVEADCPGAYFAPEIEYLSVGSQEVQGQFFGAGLDGLLAAASYLPLAGDASLRGDGITPFECAMLPGAEQREVDACHIGFVPFVGARLLGTRWYGSEGIAEQWLDWLD